jgi:beta-phosphoglucomutase-like phosphatase (HAD superfamily)
MIRLGVMPDHVLIVEDSDKGLQSAEASGAQVLMVAGAHELARRLCARLEHEGLGKQLGAVA